MPGFLCAPPTTNNGFFIAGLAVCDPVPKLDLASCFLVPLLAPTIIVWMLWEADSEIEFSVYVIHWSTLMIMPLEEVEGGSRIGKGCN